MADADGSVASGGGYPKGELMPIAAQRRGRVIWRETITPRAATPNADGIIAQSSWPFPVFGIWSNSAGTSSGGFNIRRATLTGFGLTAGQISSMLWIWSTSGHDRATYPAVSDVHRNGFLVIEQGDIVNYIDFASGAQQTLITHRNRWVWTGEQVASGTVLSYGFTDLAHAPATFTFYAPLDEWHYTDDRWVFDWDGDGSFDHARSDVTADLEGYDYDYGLQVQPNLPNLPIAAADGELRLRNPDGRYTAGSVNAISVARLRARTLVRHVNSAGDVMWEGYAEPPKAANEAGVSYADFPLAGKSREQLNEATYRVYSSSTNAAIFRNLCSDVGLTVGDVVSDDIHTGQAIVSGTAVETFRQIRAFSGGWVYERQDGAVNLTSSFGLTRESEATLDSGSFEMLKEATVQTDEEGVRNRGTAREITTKPSGVEVVFEDEITVAAGGLWSGGVSVVESVQGAVRYDQLTVVTNPSPPPAGVSIADDECRGGLV